MKKRTSELSKLKKQLQDHFRGAQINFASPTAIYTAFFSDYEVTVINFKFDKASKKPLKPDCYTLQNGTGTSKLEALQSFASELSENYCDRVLLTPCDITENDGVEAAKPRLFLPFDPHNERSSPVDYTMD